MSKHTLEPWCQSGKDSVVAESDQLNNGEYILECFGPDRKTNARRIVACVNACEGMEDPAAFIAGLRSELQLATHKLLTCGVAARHPDASLSRRESDYGGKWNSPQAESVRQLRQQRDDLLAALDEILQAVVNLREDYPAEAWRFDQDMINRIEAMTTKGGAS